MQPGCWCISSLSMLRYVAKIWVHFKFVNVMVCSQGAGAFQVCQCYDMWLGCGCISNLSMLRYVARLGAFQVCQC